MGIIFDNNVKETKIYQAYGLTVYGKINRYESTFRNETESALITIRITDENGNNIFAMYMGNNCIFQSCIDNTLDNFLWWIVEDKPDNYSIEKQVYKSLCASDSLFNHEIQNCKMRKRREEKEQARITELKAQEETDKLRVQLYCAQNGYYPYFAYNHVYIIKLHNEKAEDILKAANNKQMESLIEFMQIHPENKDAHIVQDGNMEEILQYIA